MLQRVISVFKGEPSPNCKFINYLFQVFLYLTNLQDETLSMSSNSTYSPISVVVPALKQNHSIISDIAENLTGGQPIDPIYHPDDFYSQSAQEEDSDNFDIRDPQSYEISHENPSSSPTSPESPNTVESRMQQLNLINLHTFYCMMVPDVPDIAGLKTNCSHIISQN